MVQDSRLCHSSLGSGVNSRSQVLVISPDDSHEQTGMTSLKEADLQTKDKLKGDTPKCHAVFRSSQHFPQRLR